MSWGYVAVAAATVIGGAMSKNSSDKAADAAKKGADASVAEQRRQYDTTRQDQMPWMDAGRSALLELQQLNAGNFSSFKQSPDYRFTFDQGMDALDRGAAARGAMFSGGADADRIAYGQGMASQQYGTYYNRLASLAGLGQTTASGLGTHGMNMASNIGNAHMNAANARSSSYQQQGQNWASTIGSLGGLAGNYFANRPPAGTTGGSGMPAYYPGGEY